jgi:HlyD family secretion protein
MNVGKKAGFFGALLLTAIVGCGRASNGRIVASGTVEARESLLGFQLPGRIATVLVQEGDSVVAGDTLAALDRSELDARLAAAQANAAAARALLTELRTGSRSEDIGQARAALRAAETRYANSRSEVERSRRLFEGGAISSEMLDNQRTAMEVAEADVDRAQEALNLVQAGPRSERIAAQAAQVRQADAAVAQVEATIQNATVVAPFSGLVTRRHHEPGEIVSPGLPVLTLMNPDDRWVRVYVLENQVGRISLGQVVTISADSYVDRTYEGVISHISDRAEFTPRNVQTTEERVKLVYEVRVRVTGDRSFDLKPGVAADVTFESATT